MIISQTDGKWFFCKHKERNTFEVPGGHREPGESIEDTARRKLREETGATDFSIKPICVYSVKEEEETYGMLFIADIFSFGEINSEIEEIIITDSLIDEWTYPLIQPKLIQEAKSRGYL